MEATENLMEEHRLIERFLAALEAACRNLEHGQESAPRFFIEAADFIESFAEHCHNKKEEQVLFKAMINSGFPTEGGPIEVMLYEHGQGRQYTNAIREAADRLLAGDGSATGPLIENAMGYASLLGQHIIKEDTALFPMADRIIPADRHAEVAAAFERISREASHPCSLEDWRAAVSKLENEAEMPGAAKQAT